MEGEGGGEAAIFDGLFGDREGIFWNFDNHFLFALSYLRDYLTPTTTAAATTTTAAIETLGLRGGFYFRVSCRGEGRRQKRILLQNFAAVEVFLTFFLFFHHRMAILGLALNKSTRCLTKMDTLLVGQRVGSLGHRDPTIVPWVLVMCLDEMWLKLTTVLVCMLA